MEHPNTISTWKMYMASSVLPLLPSLGIGVAQVKCKNIQLKQRLYYPEVRHENDMIQS